MVKQITLTHSERFSCEFYCDDKLATKSNNKLHHVFTTASRYAKYKIMIKPWKIKPLIRFDNFLVNYGLAKITPWDHMIEFTIGDNFQQEYFQAIIDAKKTYLKKNGDTVPNDMEYFVGINNLHPEIIESISNNIK